MIFILFYQAVIARMSSITSQKRIPFYIDSTIKSFKISVIGELNSLILENPTGNLTLTT